MSIDQLDVQLITLVSEHTGISVVECARRLGVARATAQGRLDRLRRSGVIASEAPTIDPEALGFPLRTFCTLQIRQSIGHHRVAEGLARIPEIVDLHTITGDYDMIATIVSRSTRDMQRVLDLVSNTEGVARVSTRLALESHLENRTLPLVRTCAPGLVGSAGPPGAAGAAGAAGAPAPGVRARTAPGSGSRPATKQTSSSASTGTARIPVRGKRPC